MAISQSDGSIILTTKVDESGIKSGVSKVKSGIGTLTKAIGAIGVATASGFVAISKMAVDSFAEYEQLVGGVETLFKDSSKKLIEYADQAYQSAGLSANEYMSTVTSFSASLLQSLGGDTDKATEYANQAIIDMSDNANKMGTSMEMIQNAYQGFAKQNYTMLDNLKLGYGGTKEEMQRLLDDAEKISGIKYDISSFADVTQAIHIMQTELGITGTTAKEASTTIQGSASAMKASWQNLLTGIADPTQNFGKLLENFIGSVGTFLGNLMPVITNATQGVLQMVQGLLPQIPVLIEEMLPVVVNGILSIITEIVKALPEFLNTGIKVLLSIIEGLTEALPNLIEMLPEIISTIITVLIENLPLIISTGVELLIGIITGITNAIPEFVEFLPTIIETMINVLLGNLPLLIECAFSLLLAIVEGLTKALPRLVLAVPQIITSIVKTLNKNLPNLVKSGKTLLESVINGMKSILSKVGDMGKNIVQGLWNGISGSLSWIKNKISGWVGNVTDFIKNLFGIHSPSTVFRDEIGENLMLGLAKGITGNENVVTNALGNVSNALLETEFGMGTISTPQMAINPTIPYFAQTTSSASVGNLSLDAIRKSVAEVVATMNGGFNSRIEVPVIIDGRELLRVVRSNENAVGTQTVFGGFANAY